jgi:hypothetical protein
MFEDGKYYYKSKSRSNLVTMKKGDKYYYLNRSNSWCIANKKDYFQGSFFYEITESSTLEKIPFAKSSGELLSGSDFTEGRVYKKKGGRAKVALVSGEICYYCKKTGNWKPTTYGEEYFSERKFYEIEHDAPVDGPIKQSDSGEKTHEEVEKLLTEANNATYLPCEKIMARRREWLIANDLEVIEKEIENYSINEQREEAIRKIQNDNLEILETEFNRIKDLGY